MDKSAESNIPTIKLFWETTKKYKYVFFLSYGFTMVATGIAVAVPLLYKDFFDVLAGVAAQSSIGNTAQLVHIIVNVLVLHMLIWVSWRISGFANISLTANVRRDLTNSAFDYVTKHSHSFFDNTFSGALVRKIKRLESAYDRIISEIEYNLLPLAVTIVGVLWVLFARNILLGTVLLIWTLLFMYASYRFSVWKQKHDKERAELDSKAGSILADSISNTHTVKLFAGELHEQELHSSIIEKIRNKVHFLWSLNEWVNASQAALTIAIEFIVFYFAIDLWKEGLITIGDFALIQSYLLAIFSRVWNFGRVIQSVYESFAEAKEMVDILETPHEIKDKPGAKKLIVKDGAIEFDSVSFSFNQTRRVFNEFSLSIDAGEKVAFVGPSGVGKSTLTKLLFRLYDIQSGHIRIDGQDVSEVTQESLRQHIALVPQDPILFHRSLKENIVYGKQDATDKELFKASKQAHCHEFIERLQDGYETLVGERGVKLSGGERQRVAIARAILKDAPILVLDEATSSLDSESESLIQEALATLMKGRTTIIIAHRLSTIMQADRIVVLGDTGVVTTGTHKELMEKEGLYKKLWDLQAGGFIE